MLNKRVLCLLNVSPPFSSLILHGIAPRIFFFKNSRIQMFLKFFLNLVKTIRKFHSGKEGSQIMKDEHPKLNSSYSYSPSLWETSDDLSVVFHQVCSYGICN